MQFAIYSSRSRKKQLITIMYFDTKVYSIFLMYDDPLCYTIHVVLSIHVCMRKILSYFAEIFLPQRAMTNNRMYDYVKTNIVVPTCASTVPLLSRTNRVVC